MNYQEFMPDQLRASIRDRLTEVLAERDRAGNTSYSLMLFWRDPSRCQATP
jgi:hypothetical protein